MSTWLQSATLQKILAACLLPKRQNLAVSANLQPSIRKVGPGLAATSRCKLQATPENRAGAAGGSRCATLRHGRKGDLISHLKSAATTGSRCLCSRAPNTSPTARRPSQSEAQRQCHPQQQEARGPAPAPWPGFKNRRDGVLVATDWPPAARHRELPHVVKSGPAQRGSPRLWCTGSAGRPRRPERHASRWWPPKSSELLARDRKRDRASLAPPEVCRASSPPIHSAPPLDSQRWSRKAASRGGVGFVARQISRRPRRSDAVRRSASSRHHSLAQQPSSKATAGRGARGRLDPPL